MHKPVFTAITLTALISGQAMANEKLTLVLDWYINPDHAPIMVAEQIGAFKAQGLDVKIVPPSDPALPPRLVAAGQADLAITYQPQVHFFADEGLPLVRVGTLINSPLNTIIALDKRIKTPADLKGKKVGYSVSGIEQATLATMAQHDHIDPQSIKLINVNFKLTSALLAGQVAAQYADPDGQPSMDIRYNPSGSAYAIEALTSPDGRIMGRMGHSERMLDGLYNNLPTSGEDPLFLGAVDYFK